MSRKLRSYAFFIVCVLMQAFLVHIVEASGKPCPNPREGGCCAPNWCYCSGDNCGGGSAITTLLSHSLLNLLNFQVSEPLGR